jgi:ankyrin repeat protein
VQQAGNVDMVEYLLERGAAHKPSAIAHTAIRSASIFGHEHVARMLLQA